MPVKATRESLLAQCERAEESRRQCGMDPAEARIFIIVHRSREPRGERVRLAPGVTGRYIGWLGDDSYHIEVKAADVRRMLDKEQER